MRHVLRGLIVISLLASLFLGGLLIYSLHTSKNSGSAELERNTAKNNNPVELKQGRVDDYAVNLIFYTSSDGKELKEVVTEVLDSKQGRLTYISIPLDTIVDVDAELYQKLSAVSPEMPQRFQLLRLGTMFKYKNRYAYAQLILDELLRIDSSSYLVIKGEAASFSEYRKVIQRSMPLNSEAEIRQAVIQGTKGCRSNLSKKKRAQYAQGYAMIKHDSIKEIMAEGKQHNAGFEIDAAKFVFLGQE